MLQDAAKRDAFRRLLALEGIFFYAFAGWMEILLLDEPFSGLTSGSGWIWGVW